MNFERKGVNPLLLVFLAISGVNPLTCRITELEDIFPFFRILRTVMLQYHERGVNPLSWCCSCGEFGEYHERGVNPLSGCCSFGGFGGPRGQQKGTLISTRRAAVATRGDGGERRRRFSSGRHWWLVCRLQRRAAGDGGTS